MRQMFFCQDEYYGRGLLEGEIRIKHPLFAELLRFLCQLSLRQTFGACSPAIEMEKIREKAIVTLHQEEGK